MRSLFFEDVNRLGWRDMPMPRPQADHEAVVQTIAATACVVDNMVIKGGDAHGAAFRTRP